MQNLITPSSPELIAADKALRRAAANVKKQAELQGTPYVVYCGSNTGKIFKNPRKLRNKKVQTVADGKDSVASKPVFNRTVTLLDTRQK